MCDLAVLVKTTVIPSFCLTAEIALEYKYIYIYQIGYVNNTRKRWIYFDGTFDDDCGLIITQRHR